MCGIVGFVGNNAVANVLDGLGKLEYRGYDSAGVTYKKSSGGINTIKRAGRLQNVINSISDNGSTWSRIAIGHTRWATHGEPTEINAHPHTAGRITVVHNGIVDNYLELKEYILGSGREIISDTDTEIIAHLIDMAEAHITLLEKVKLATQMLKGSYALAVIQDDIAEEMVVARKGSPLVVGVSKKWKGTVISSDIQGIVKYTNLAYILEDEEFAKLTSEGVEFYDRHGMIQKETLSIDWSPEVAERGTFDTFMRKEIQEQPVALIDTLMRTNWNHVRSHLMGVDFSDILFVACGTSYNASKVGTIFMEMIGGIHSRARLASEVCFNTRIRPNTLVIAVSQSGETADTLSAARIARKAGAKVMAIVNVVGSSLTREADYVVYTAAGPEISVASTKAFTSQLSAIYMLGAVLNNSVADVKAILSDLSAHMQMVFDQEEKIEKIAEGISEGSVLFLGRGIHTPVAYEGALKLKEISYLHAEGLPAGEIKHGPIALIAKGTPVVVLVPKGETHRKMIANINEVRSRGAYVIAIATQGEGFIDSIADEVLYMPDVPEIFTPIMSVLHLQLLSYHIARKLGRDVDYPRNLAKSVTVE